MVKKLITKKYVKNKLIKTLIHVLVNKWLIFGLIMTAWRDTGSPENLTISEKYGVVKIN